MLLQQKHATLCCLVPNAKTCLLGRARLPGQVGSQRNATIRNDSQRFATIRKVSQSFATGPKSTHHWAAPPCGFERPITFILRSRPGSAFAVAAPYSLPTCAVGRQAYSLVPSPCLLPTLPRRPDWLCFVFFAVRVPCSRFRVPLLLFPGPWCLVPIPCPLHFSKSVGARNPRPPYLPGAFTYARANAFACAGLMGRRHAGREG